MNTSWKDNNTLRRYEEAQVTPAVLKHMDHQEDLVYYGEMGVHMLIDTLEDVYSYLTSNVPSHGSRITQKIDGSPAVLAATDFNGEKFVALKHSWDKGKRFHSEEELKEYYKDSPELLDKLISLFNYIDKIGIPKDQIWMGDYLFSNRDLESVEIEGENYVVFRPNTVVYAVPETDPLAKKIREADIGIVWHTKYTGTFEELKKSFDVSLDSINTIPEVFQSDVNINFNSVLFSKEETEIITSLMERLNRAADSLISDPHYEMIIQNKKVVARMQKYKNEIIRQHEVELGDYFSAQNLKAIMVDEINSHIAGLSRSNDIARNEKARDALAQFLDDTADAIEKFYNVQALCVELKNMFIKKMEKSVGMRMFYQSLTRGYIPCGGEGFVVSDAEGNVAKLVTRIGFSLANWQQDIIKGWMSDKRENS